MYFSPNKKSHTQQSAKSVTKPLDLTYAFFKVNYATMISYISD